MKFAVRIYQHQIRIQDSFFINYDLNKIPKCEIDGNYSGRTYGGFQQWARVLSVLPDVLSLQSGFTAPVSVLVCQVQ